MEKETSQDTGKPYVEVGEVRIFSNTILEDDLVWHRDREDRIVEALHKTDWQFQLENELPKELTSIFIPKETYHRLIKGSGDVQIKVTKL